MVPLNQDQAHFLPEHSTEPFGQKTANVEQPVTTY